VTERNFNAENGLRLAHRRSAHNCHAHLDSSTAH
jgi:hypothetical protein